MKKETIIVVGNGMVGYKFCERLSEKDTQNKYKIITFAEEGRPAYDRVHLTKYFETKNADDLTMAAISWYEENGIDLHLGDSVIKIDRERKAVISAKGQELAYDKLILATGSGAFVPPVAGVEKEGVFVYRTIEDLEKITAYASKSETCAVIGGGLLGLEAAKAAQDLGLKSSVVEFAPRLMPRQLDDQGGKMLKKLIEDRGLEVLLNKSTKLFAGEAQVTALDFADGTSLPADMVIISAGIRPRDELARTCGLAVGDRGGILVNEQLQTSDKDIFAIGECALFNSMIYGLVAPGYNMADAVATNLCGGFASFEGADMSTKLKLIGTDVANIGLNETADEAAEEHIYNNPAEGVYKKLIVKEGQLIGAVLVGNADEYGRLLQFYQNGMDLPADPSALILPAGNAEVEGGGIGDLPDSAQICSCENISKGAICSAIDEQNLCSVADIKKCTKAGSGCGGCLPMVKDVLDYKMKEAGQEVSTALCEHFEYSRTELYEIVRIKGIKKFDELLGTHGKGMGCEICKPVAASIFASVHNEPILDHADLQDTNDAFLANIQKNGTYSIVPRIPGGEITPDKLIVLGQVAKDYDLYLKITGGQRIDLFGARLEQLPEIWEIFIEAGFESGHAYGKSLRTIKSCVGSTWCRFGVQNSTKMAIQLEERYRGIRSPHKIKSAVSGCTRECAEAQSKDFGVIATEKGWNLYVCGNGGMKPRHADLLASDLDDETLVKYIDRFLMYYIKTADRLVRTSVWMDKLEGGLQHLKEVVIDDKLGLCAEFEEQMQYLVDTYVCEWKDAVNSPEKRRRFRTFINTNEADKGIEFEREREQIKPALARAEV